MKAPNTPILRHIPAEEKQPSTPSYSAERGKRQTLRPFSPLPHPFVFSAGAPYRPWIIHLFIISMNKPRSSAALSGDIGMLPPPGVLHDSD